MSRVFCRDCILTHTILLFLICRFFCQTKYASFQRQLNLYGFQRFLHHSRDKGAYYHACFIRGNRALVRNILRRKIKGSSSSNAASKLLMPHEEPDFYKTIGQRNNMPSKSAVVVPVLPEQKKTTTTTTPQNAHSVLTRDASTGTAYFEGSRFHFVDDEPLSEPTPTFRCSSKESSSTSSTSSRSSSKKKNHNAETILAQELAKIREQIRQKQAEYQKTVARQALCTASKRVSWETKDSADINNRINNNNYYKFTEDFSPMEESLYVAL